MKTKTITILTLVIVFALAFSGAVTAYDTQPLAQSAQVENSAGLSTFATPRALSSRLQLYLRGI